MATKKYLSLDRLTEYDALIKQEIDKGDESTLSTAKSYTDTQIANIPSVDAYTKDEIDAVLEGKSDSTHNHDSDYDAKGSADTALETAKSYTDTKTSGLASTSSVNTSISTHNTSTSAHNDIRDLITGLTNRLNALADSDDTTLDQMSEVVAYIKANKSLIDGITTSKVNVSDIVNNLTTNVSDKPLSAAQGVAINGLIDALQTAVDGKAPSSHSHTITASASDDDVVVLTGTSGSNKVTYSASHADSGVTVGTYKSVTVDVKGHVTGGTNPTTLAGYGITDAATKVALDSLTTTVNGKANSSHTHAISDVTNLQSSLDAKVPATRAVNGKALSENITLSASDVNAYTKAEIDDMEFITTADIDAICGDINIISITDTTY